MALEIFKNSSRIIEGKYLLPMRCTKFLVAHFTRPSLGKNQFSLGLQTLSLQYALVQKTSIVGLHFRKKIDSKIEVDVLLTNPGLHKPARDFFKPSNY